MADETNDRGRGSDPAPLSPIPPTRADGSFEKEQGDIAKILAEVKLPERRSPQPGAGAEPKKFDTNLGAMQGESASPTPKTPSAPPGAAASPEIPEPVILEESVALRSGSPSAGKTNIASVHTLKDDLQHVVRDQKISVVRAASLEQDRRHHLSSQSKESNARLEGPTPGEVQRGKRALGILFSVVLLLILGGSALGGVYLIAQQRAGSTPQREAQSILFAESTVALPISSQSPADLKRVLGNARQNASGTLGSITRIVPIVSETSEDGATNTRPATFSEFMKAVSSGAPDDLLRATGSDFFFGIHAVDKNAPVIVVPVASYDRAFAAMLAWEPAMNAGLAPIFTPLSAQTTDQNGLPINRTFQDIVMRNYDVRAQKDDAGNVALYYSFPTQNILVIAESPFSFAEILSRLQAERKL